MRTFLFRLRHLSSNTILLIGFFIFITIGLFLGDGKQALIDIYGAGGILALFIFAKSYCKKYREIPRNITVLWGAVLLYFIVRTIFSDSVAYSINATMRMIMGYLIFAIFYEYADEKYPKHFTQGLIIFSIVAMIASFFFLLFPHQANMLPLMNLLYAYYGHNYLANILIIVYPIALLSVLKTSPNNPLPFKRRGLALKICFANFQGEGWSLPILYFILIVVSLFFTFSRGAEVLVGLYTIFQIGLLRPKKISKRMIVVIGIGILGIFSIVLFSLITTYNAHSVTNNPQFSRFTKEIVKPSLLEEGRLQYWKQAILTIKDHPLFGTGPGTFALDSKRYQEAPNQYSWFAHNFIFQELSELGFLGGMILFLLFEILFSHTKRKYSFLVVGIYLIFLQSLFEFNLDFLIIWFILWSTIGLMVVN